MSNVLQTTVRVKEAAELLKAVIAHNIECGKAKRPATEYIVPFLKGDPGIGKTSIANQASEAMGVGCQTVVTVAMDVTDMMGLPTIEKDGDVNYTTWSKPDLLFRLKDGDTIFLDEFTKSPPMLQNVGSQLLEERRINNHYIGNLSTVIVAGNHIANRAGDQELPSHVSQRMMHLNLVNPIEDVLEYAASINLATEVTGFLGWKRGGAISFDPNATCNPTQRSWFKVAQHCCGKHFSTLPRQLFRATVCGYVGDGQATQFMAFLKCREDMPHPEKIIANPEGERVPGEGQPEVLWAIVSALTGHATVKTIGPIMRYLKRIKAAEFTVFAIKDIMSRHPKLNSAPEVMEWKMKNRHLFTPVL